MKLAFKKDKIIIYLNKIYIPNLDLNNKEQIYKYTKNILYKLEKNYNLHLSGYYNINIYLDDNYGIIMEIIEENTYIDYFENTLDINIKTYKDSFLYEVNNINDINDCITYIHNNHIYVKLKKTFSKNLITNFIEKIIDIKYGTEKKPILKSLKVLEW